MLVDDVDNAGGAEIKYPGAASDGRVNLVAFHTTDDGRWVLSAPREVDAPRITSDEVNVL